MRISNYEKALLQEYASKKGMEINVSLMNCKDLACILPGYKDWLYEKKYQMEKYAKFLKESGIEETVLELNKSKEDSISSYLNKEGINTRVLSPHKVNENLHLDAKLEIVGNKPILLYKNTTEMLHEINCNPTFDSSIKTLMTQLPLDDDKLVKTLAKASKTLEVVIGSYGSLSDKDYAINLTRLYEVGKILTKYSKREYEIVRNFKNNGLYMEYIKPKVKARN